jgi:SanA protein
MKRLVFGMLKGVALVITVTAVINGFIFFSTTAYIYHDTAIVPTAAVVLIPGAAILASGALSPIFVDRVDTAITLYRNKTVAKILVSGDNSTVSYNEVNPVRLYLLDKGVADEDIFLDHAGFDTYSTMYRARAIFGVSSVVIATQSFHLPRAVFIARQLGMDAYGIDADKGHMLVRNYIREVFADEKAVMDLVTHRVPKYLGDTIPIDADGRDYP